MNDLTSLFDDLTLISNTAFMLNHEVLMSPMSDEKRLAIKNMAQAAAALNEVMKNA